MRATNTTSGLIQEALLSILSSFLKLGCVAIAGRVVAVKLQCDSPADMRTSGDPVGTAGRGNCGISESERGAQFTHGFSNGTHRTILHGPYMICCRKKRLSCGDEAVSCVAPYAPSLLM